MGHALFTTIQDIIIRHKRMTGHNTLWQPGTDHAGLATHDKIMSELAQAGISTPSRDQYFFQAEQWKSKTGNRITEQIRRLGASCDWSRERYTLDDRHTNTTIEAFCRLFDQGLIYRNDNQWWLDTSGMAEQILAQYYGGNIKIIPEHEGKTFCHFLENIEPWCLSRQIWWGHRIPMWYDSSGNCCSARNEIEARAKLGTDHITQDSDVLDTWFSSALWPFALLGWPDDTPDMKMFYPANLIETADDILFFWCARMMMMGITLTGMLPFDTIYLHGIIRDKHGRKMCKSLGNGIDPLEMIDQYGCDALRLALSEHCTPGQDIKLNPAMFDSAKKFCNKLWQASRFCLMHHARIGKITDDISTHDDDVLILAECDQMMRNINEYLCGYQIREAAFCLRSFIKNRFCDWYIERSKCRLYDNDQLALNTLILALRIILKCGHPIMPYITEMIYSSFNDHPLITAQW